MSSEAKHTPGPWAWFGNANSNSLYLATTHSGRRYVMGFKRWGMRGAQPQFQPEHRGLVDASELLQFAVGRKDIRGVAEAKADPSVYRMDVTGVDCADARLIAAAPDLLDALPDLSHVIAWLENGCDPLKARDELLIYKARIDAAKAKAEGQS